jgi:aspartate-semialdehyde dehydrogenase
MKVAVIGATGMVGSVMMSLLEERKFPVTEFIPVASSKSVGQRVRFKGNDYPLVSMEEAVALRPHLALFSAGGSVSLENAPKFAAVGTTVIDNSSAWRMNPNNKLIVPEINGFTLTAEDKIIANPNCSTIQMVITLNPLHQKYGVKRVVVSTYQSISGTGVKAVRQLENERAGKKEDMIYPYPIDMNCLPHCDEFMENAYTKEEMKLVQETKKIMGDESIRVTATAVRVPVMGGHSESVNIEMEKEYDLQELRKLLNATEGIVVQDNPDTNTYPMPLYAKGRDEVFVGRIRRDESQERTINLWIVADNLRKGAATNAVQIAEYLLKNKLL